MPEETREEKRARKQRAGAWLLAERERLGLSQATLAQRAGLPSQNRVSNYENGVYEIKSGIAVDLAHALGLTEYETFRGLEIRLPAEVATRRQLIAFAMELMTDKQAEDLLARLLPQLRARRRGGKNPLDQAKPTRVTQSGKDSSGASRGAESAI